MEKSTGGDHSSYRYSHISNKSPGGISLCINIYKDE